MTTMTLSQRFFLLAAYHHREGALLRGPRG